MMDWLQSEEGRAAIAGALGGVVRWLSPPRADWLTGMTTVVVGAICAVYLSPLVVYWLTSNPSPQMLSAAGFVTGVAGISVSSFILSLWQAWRAHLTRGLGK